MRADIQDLGGLQRRVDLTVAATDVAQEVSQRLARIARQSSMPGFRRGKVPMKIVAASYGSQIQAEVMREKLGSALSTALDASKLRLAGAPRLEPQSAQDAGQIAFSATFEVYPEIDLGDLSRVELHRYTCSVSEADVDQTVEIVRRQRAKRAAVEREAADGDRVTVDFRGTIDGQEFEGGEAKDFSFNLGGGRIAPRPAVAIHGELSARLPGQQGGGSHGAVRLDGQAGRADRIAAGRCGIRPSAWNRGRRPVTDAGRTQSQCGARGGQPPARAHARARFRQAARGDAFRGAAGSGRRGTAAPREGRGGGRGAGRRRAAAGGAASGAARAADRRKIGRASC